MGLVVTLVGPRTHGRVFGLYFFLIHARGASFFLHMQRAFLLFRGGKLLFLHMRLPLFLHMRLFYMQGGRLLFLHMRLYTPHVLAVRVNQSEGHMGACKRRYTRQDPLHDPWREHCPLNVFVSGSQ